MKLNDKILLAMARYYNARRLANEISLHEKLSDLGVHFGFSMHRSKPEVKDGVKVFDKEKLLKDIDELAEKAGFTFQASAGTFWFSYKTKRHAVTIGCNEDDYLDGGSERIRVELTVRDKTKDLAKI